MTPRRRYKIQFISIICVSLIILVLIIYHMVFSSYSFRESHDMRDLPHVYFDKGTTKGIIGQILTHPKSEAFHGEKLIHFDLKGAPPLVSYFREFFPYIRKLGATGVLIEYEDMFYYKEDLEEIRALNAYQPSEIKEILELAEINNLSVIPLIQTFGHFEFVLKLDKFKDLREIKAYPQVLCPSHERVLSVIKKMIDQILEAHPKAKYIHIGCDEVLYLGECDKCKAAMQENYWSTSELFLNHVESIALYINKTYPGVRPMIWGDMIGRISEKLLKKSKISNLVDVMVWKYVPNVSDYITKDMLSMYARVFKTIWIASAFKGATGVNQKITDARYHLANHIAWMKIVSNWKSHINFKGITLTGWQRYDHFAELCELLPVAIPSLTLNLHYISGSEKGSFEYAFEFFLGLWPNASPLMRQTPPVPSFVCNFDRKRRKTCLNYHELPQSYKGASVNELLEILQCHPSNPLTPVGYDFSTDLGKCNFPGFTVYQLVTRFHSLSSKITNHFSVTYGGWFSIYNIVHKFSSPAYVKDIFDKWPVDKNLKEVKALEEDLRKALLEIYDEFTVEEWILTNVAPIQLRLEAFCIAKEAVLKQDVWPRRPLSNNSEDLERAAREICTSDRKFGCALLLI